jgi:hypothetical protein
MVFMDAPILGDSTNLMIGDRVFLWMSPQDSNSVCGFYRSRFDMEPQIKVHNHQDRCQVERHRNVWSRQGTWGTQDVEAYIPNREGT